MKWIPLERVGELEERLRLLIRSGTIFDRRDALAMVLGLYGLRGGEARAADVEHLHVTGNRLLVPVFKGGVERNIPLDPGVVSLLLESREDFPETTFLFSTIKGKRVHASRFATYARRVTRRLYGKAIRFHALRHTFAMRLYGETKDILQVKQFLGHRSVRSTEIYARSTAVLPLSCVPSIEVAGPVALAQPSPGRLAQPSPGRSAEHCGDHWRRSGRRGERDPVEVERLRGLVSDGLRDCDPRIREDLYVAFAERFGPDLVAGLDPRVGDRQV